MMVKMGDNFERLKRHSHLVNAVSLFLLMIYGASSERTTEFHVTPRVVQRGRNVTMACLSDLQHYEVYSVKWYKETEEFYKYSPLDRLKTKVSHVDGITVDRFHSNETHVVLVNLTPDESGNYSCEVIQNVPSFPRYVAVGLLDVVEKGGVKATDLVITPRVVERGGSASLTCLYVLTDAPLYSVKWYRGHHEFYRYSPTESPSTKIFAYPGINVDLANSNQTQVVLTKVSFGLAGNFSCEVTADAPSFSTSIVYNRMEVVVFPPKSPTIITNQHYYTLGDILRVNCTSGPSRPAPELTFYMNDIQVRSGQYQVIPAANSLFRANLNVQLQLWPAHYERGAPILRCEANIKNIYRDNHTVALYSANTDPKIERVTSPGSAAKVPSCQIIPLLIIILWANDT